MPINLDGILLPVTTPFLPDEAPDFAGLAKNIEHWNESGIAGYVVLGSTGERGHLDEQEYFQVIEAARRAVPDHLTFIAGAGQQSTRGTISEIERAVLAGAEAVLVITPGFYRAAITQEALISHYSAVADSSKVPVILYSMPDLTGVVIEPATADSLSKHENIIGMKDSSADVTRFAEAVRLLPPHFALMIGNGTVLCTNLAAGARGGILAVGCVATRLCLEVFKAVRTNALDRARALQNQLTPLALAVTKTYGIGGLKAAMEMIGLVGGAVRAPLRPPDETGIAEIARLIEQVRQT